MYDKKGKKEDLFMKQKKCLVIYNPISGKWKNKDIIKKYENVFKQRGYIVDFIKTEYSNHASEIMASAGEYDIVFSVGGDGTLNEVVKGNYNRDKKLVICPLPNGTCNDVARMFGYGKNPLYNLCLALDGEIYNVDIGTINDNPFVYVVGMGNFMNIPYETPSEEKKKLGYMAYLKKAMLEIVNEMKKYNMEIIIDGVKLNGSYSLIMVSNANHIAGIKDFYKDVYLNDGELEVLLCNSVNIFEILTNFIKFMCSKKTNKIISLKAKNINIKINDNIENKWCIDGECYNCDGTWYNIKVKDRMQFLIPKKKSKRIFK